MRDASVVAAVLLATAVLFYVCGDARLAAWVGIPGAAYTLFAVWRAEKT
jgi:hypothetical protein